MWKMALKVKSSQVKSKKKKVKFLLSTQIQNSPPLVPEFSQLISRSRSSKVAWYVGPGTLEIPQWGGLRAPGYSVACGRDLLTTSFDMTD